MTISEIGVSRTRIGPNSARSPSVTLNTPPLIPTSWPITTTAGSRRISARSVSLSTWTMVRPAVASAIEHPGPGRVASGERGAPVRRVPREEPATRALRRGLGHREGEVLVGDHLLAGLAHQPLVL